MPGVSASNRADIEPYGTLQSALPFKNKDGSDLKKPPRPALPTDKVRCRRSDRMRGRADLAQAKDASEAIEVDIEALRSSPHRPRQSPRTPRRSSRTCRATSLDFHYGDSKVERRSRRPRQGRVES